jgi:hypothetical protein
MTTFTSRGKQLLQDVIALETAVTKNGTNKTIGKKVDSLELRLSTIRGDFERQAKNVASKIPANKRSNQNVVNAANRVKKVKISEMNSELAKMRKLTSGAAPVSASTASASTVSGNSSIQEIKNLFAKTEGQIKNVGSKIGV